MSEPPGHSGLELDVAVAVAVPKVEEASTDEGGDEPAREVLEEEEPQEPQEPTSLLLSAPDPPTVSDVDDISVDEPAQQSGEFPSWLPEDMVFLKGSAVGPHPETIILPLATATAQQAPVRASENTLVPTQTTADTHNSGGTIVVGASGVNVASTLLANAHPVDAATAKIVNESSCWDRCMPDTSTNGGKTLCFAIVLAVLLATSGVAVTAILCSNGSCTTGGEQSTALSIPTSQEASESSISATALPQTGSGISSLSPFGNNTETPSVTPNLRPTEASDQAPTATLDTAQPQPEMNMTLPTSLPPSVQAGMPTTLPPSFGSLPTADELDPAAGDVNNITGDNLLEVSGTTTLIPTTQIGAPAAATALQPVSNSSSPQNSMPTSAVNVVPTSNVSSAPPAVNISSSLRPSITVMPTTRAPAFLSPSAPGTTSSPPSTRLPTTGTSTPNQPTTRLPTTRTPTSPEPSTKPPSATNTPPPTSKPPTTRLPTTRAPTSRAPTTRPPSTAMPTTNPPTTDPPTRAPTTRDPTSSPTRMPTTPGPTPLPTKQPTPDPTPLPTPVPTTPEPTPVPTPLPTTPDPTPFPTRRPTLDPTPDPTRRPTPDPTPDPTRRPTPDPTPDPTRRPTRDPTRRPTRRPTPEPTRRPRTPEPTTRPRTPEPTRRPRTPEPTPRFITQPPQSMPGIDNPTLLPLRRNLFLAEEGLLDDDDDDVE
ncbi:Hemolysin-type calcium-binding repeat (2 copies) [Seminavis robusta]|uniref:Hemolysin-type calcium-binding repeat (2 copies) n=1 Tax=Seminavis robusta TaxID=568900 RepID=A0A9N8EE01_9STRA|nr:Hemolysin-type calcium-binding repeat (2 copies) [Seminavis robusta]|eukprot:Sro952_g224030.1 Hemolysin-type calcium-binding repeat (2 copies) (708) ;mRNA; f:15611-17734